MVDRSVVPAGVLDLLPDELFGHLPDVLSIHDAEGRYLYVSGSLGTMAGFPTDALLGETPYDLGLVHPEDVESVVAMQLRALEDATPWRIQFRLRREDDAYIWVESAGTVVAAEDGHWFVALTREAGHVESLLQGIAFERRLNQQLDELLARQQRFLTTVSHSARTPLTSIKGMVELLHAHGAALDVDRRDQLLTRLRANTDRLVELLEEVTDADRLARADLVLERRLVRLRELGDEVVARLTESGTSVENLIDPALLAVVDRDRIRRLLSILVGNALRHGGVGTHVVLRGASRGAGEVELVVEDDGPGIAAVDREEVFRPFSHGSPDHHDPGAGLGLYVVSELAALHGGRAWVDDRPGGGARFHVLLPRARADQTDVSPVRVPARSATALRPAAQTVVERTLRTLRRRIGFAVVYLSILDDEHQYVLATSGDALAGIEAGRRIPLEGTFCARMVAGELEQVVGDTSEHPVARELPATADGLACYVGVPVHLPSGKVFGTLCAADAVPHPDLPPSVVDEFAAFADMLGDQLAGEGFIDGTALDAASRVAEVLTRDGALDMRYQPIVDLRSGELLGVEALLRVDGSERPTDLWFADAARAGLLVDLEVRAVELAIDAFDAMGDAAHLAINVSPRTITSPELATVLREVPVDRLVVEVSEHAVVDDYGPLVDALEPHRSAGLRLALDDMGTGFAGLGHLLQLRPDVLKIDGSVVATLHRDPQHHGAVAGLVRLADDLEADIVAAGVEDLDVLAAVRDLGITQAQGDLLGGPVGADEVFAAAEAARLELDPS